MHTTHIHRGLRCDGIKMFIFSHLIDAGRRTVEAQFADNNIDSVCLSANEWSRSKCIKRLAEIEMRWGNGASSQADFVQHHFISAIRI